MSTFKKFHREPYPAIDPTSPALSRVGKTILIIGGSSGIGRATARAFIAASASRIIIAGRRAEALTKTVTVLEAVATKLKSETVVLSRQLDLGNGSSIESFWNGLKSDGIEVDIMVLSAARAGADGVSTEWKVAWEYYEVNVLGNLRVSKEFLSQGPEKGKVLINISSIAAHLEPSSGHYSSSKAAFANLTQHMAATTPVDQCQILSFHPGRILSEGARENGYDENSIPWDNEDLPAHFCVWASSPQASLLHGRFLWAHWDVNELLAMTDKLAADPGFLKIGLQGFETVDFPAYVLMV